LISACLSLDILGLLGLCVVVGGLIVGGMAVVSTAS